MLSPHHIAGLIGLVCSLTYLGFYRQIANLCGPRPGAAPQTNVLRLLCSLFLFVFGPVIAVAVAFCSVIFLLL